MQIPSTVWRTRWHTPLAASAALAAALAACARPSVLERVGTEPDLRVGLAVGVSTVRIGGEGALVAIREGSAQFRLPAGVESRLAPEGRGVRVLDGPGAGQYEALAFVGLESGRFVLVDGKPYRGIVEVAAGAGGLVVVNQLPLEAYVAGVVNAEMGRRAPEEQPAVEAQALVSRTYALANRGKFASGGFDVRASVADQVYGGVGAETAEGRAAVRATAGQVITYRGQLITTFFHSTCGGVTADVTDAFYSARPVPYLRHVSDRRPSGGAYCDRSPRFRWSVEWDGTLLLDILRRTVPATLGVEAEQVDEVRDVRVRRVGPSGRVAEIRVDVGRGEIPVFGPDVRAVFETSDGRVLGSTAFLFEAERRDGVVRRLVAHGTGWGHGVGLCQWGAVGRARAGQDAATIVTTYFPGTTIVRLY